jgi:hypothetical protein
MPTGVSVRMLNSRERKECKETVGLHLKWLMRCIHL